MSTKHLVNQPRTGRWLILLLALLTTPLGLRAQDSYGITVAGVEVTSDNASSITGANITAGTVSYDASTKTLTLNNVSMNGNVVSSIDSLNVKLVGVSTFNIDNSDGDSEYYLFQSTNTTAKLTFSADELGATLQGYGTSTSINYNVNLNHWFKVTYDNIDYWWYEFCKKINFAVAPEIDEQFICNLPYEREYARFFDQCRYER